MKLPSGELNAPDTPMICQIGSGNGLVLPGNKPLPEPMLTQIYVVICCY